MTEAATTPAPPPFEIFSGKQASPWKILIYGIPGIGKSTLASYAPSPFFLDLENGLRDVDCVKAPVSSYVDMIAKLQWAVKSQYQTIVIDTIDEVEKYLAAEICQKHDKESIGDFGYGKDGVYLAEAWRKFLEVLNRIQAHGKNVILTGHVAIQTFKDPTSEDYDQFLPNIHKKAVPIVCAKLDAVLFARYETMLKEKEGGMPGAKKMRAVGTGKRVLICEDSPSLMAKNRMGLGKTHPMDKSLFDKIK